MLDLCLPSSCPCCSPRREEKEGEKRSFVLSSTFRHNIHYCRAWVYACSTVCGLSHQLLDRNEGLLVHCVQSPAISSALTDGDVSAVMDLQWSLPASLTSGPREQRRSVAQGSMRRCDYPVNQLWLAGWQARYWCCLARHCDSPRWRKEGLADQAAGHDCWITVKTDIKVSAW